MARKSAMHGESGYKRIPRDFYPTPHWCTEILLENVHFSGNVWEPACGKGDISDVVRSYNLGVTSSDIHNYGYDWQSYQWDFLKTTCLPMDCNNIITNPPYKFSDDFVKHALKLLMDKRQGKPLGKVAMLLRNEFSSAAKRDELFSDNPHFSLKIELTKRPQWFPKRSGKNNAPRHNYAWYVWDMQHTGKPHTIFKRPATGVQREK